MLEGRELCTCGHAREHHLQRSREKPRTSALVVSWVDAERDAAPKVKLAGCLLCACGGFRLVRRAPIR